MKKYLNTIIVFFIFIMLIGCGDSKKTERSEHIENIESVSLVILAGIHNNSKISDIHIEDCIHEAYSTFGNMEVIVIDGSPEIARTEDDFAAIGFCTKSGLDSSKENYVLDPAYWEKHFLPNMCNNTLKDMENLKPKEDEVNTLGAFQEAEKAFNQLNTDNNNIKKIIIYDTGLSTEGAVNFMQQDFFSMSETDLDYYILELKNNHELPDLNDVFVSWYGIGEVCGTQEQLSKKNIDKLKTIWKKIIEESGGTLEYIDIPSIGEYSEKPSVQSVTVNEQEENFYEKILFEGGKDTYAHINDAKIALNNMAEKINNSEINNWFIIGCTAGENSESGEYEKDLSKKRAERVMNDLIALGVKKERLSLAAMMSTDPWHVNDILFDEELHEDVAQYNRKVIIFSEKYPDYTRYYDIITNCIFQPNS